MLSWSDLLKEYPAKVVSVTSEQVRICANRCGSRRSRSVMRNVAVWACASVPKPANASAAQREHDEDRGIGAMLSQRSAGDPERSPSAGAWAVASDSSLSARPGHVSENDRFATERAGESARHGTSWRRRRIV